MLLQTIIATSALHMSNAHQKFLALDSTAYSVQDHTSPLPCLSSSPIQRSESYADALVAKQRALCLLNSALNSIASVNIDVTLAVVLLFIEFELIDYGRADWTYHISGARKIIEILCGSNQSTQTRVSSLRSCLIQNCLVYVHSRICTLPVHTELTISQIRHSRLNTLKLAWLRSK